MADNTQQYCTFRAGSRLFAAAVTSVAELCEADEPCPVPHAGELVSGLVNIRGQVRLVLDLPLLMGQEARTDSRKLVCFRDHIAKDVALAVDSFNDIVSIKNDDIVDRRANAQDIGDQTDRRKARASMVRGVATLEDEVIIVLQPEEILSGLELLTATGVTTKSIPLTG